MSNIRGLQGVTISGGGMIQRVREYTAGVNDCVPLVYIVYLVVVVVVVVSLREYNYYPWVQKNQ